MFSLIDWSGKCNSRAMQAHLCEYMEELAALSHSFCANSPGIVRFDREITGNIVVEPSFLIETSLVEYLDGFKIIEREIDRTDKIFLGVPESEHITEKYLVCNSMNLRGIQFRLCNPRDGDSPFNCVFINSEQLHDLDGRLVMVEAHDECQLYHNEFLEQADWYISTNTIFLRHYLEEWLDKLLGWMKYFFIPDLNYYHIRVLDNYEDLKDQLGRKILMTGDIEMIKREFFEELLADLRSEIKEWKSNLA